MSLDTALFICMGFFLGLSVLLQVYLAYRIRKYRQNPANTSEPRMTAKETFRFGLFHMLLYSYMIIWAVYLTWTGKFYWLLGVGIIIVGFVSIRKPVTLVRDNRPMHADWSITLPLQPLTSNVVTPELILKILEEESVIDAIKKDLQKVCQIGGKEQWRLGLVMPGMDMYDPTFQIPVKRAAILHPVSFFNADLNV